MRIIVPEIPPTNNQFMGNSHSFREYNRMKEYWHWLIRAGIKERPEQPYQKAVVTITYFFPDRRKRDPDNYSGKFILDPLVREKIIKDDSFDNIVLHIQKGGVDKQNPRTVIEVFLCQTMTSEK